MMESRQYTPPRIATRFLQWYCKPEILEDLQGDLNEYFHRNINKKGLFRGRVVYIIDVIKFVRPYTLRKPQFLNLLIQWIMISSYIKTSGRSLVRNKLFSTINIAGLAVSMSVGLLLISLLSDMLSYDRLHENGDRIYRVISKYQYLDRENGNYNASSSPSAGRQIKESVPGIENVALVYSGFSADVKNNESTVPLAGYWANESFLTVFTFPVIEGNAATALKSPFSLVLTKTSAKKLFGEKSALGQVVTTDNDQEYTITAIIQDVPKFSHMRFEMLASLSTRQITEKNRWDNEMKWDNMWQGYTYLLLPEDTDLQNIQNNLNALSEKNNPTVENVKIKLALQPLFDIALGKDLNNSIGPVMGKSEVWMIGVLTTIVILSACFNYTNLSIARATRRSREVGIRKVIGALKGHVLTQFVVEAIIISLLALGLAFILFLALKPYFLALQPKMQEMLELNLSLKVVLGFLVLATGVGIVAGFLPALLLSKLNALQVLKDTSSLRLFRHLNLRKSLIVLQYVISLIFVTATVIGFKQYKFFLAFDLGYKTENIVNIKLQGVKPDLLEKELKELPEVEAISQSLIITSVGNYWTSRMKYIDPQDSAYVNYNHVDENYIPLHEIKLMAGRNFTPLPDSAIESEVIVNEETLKRFQIANQDPIKALDEIVTVDRMKMKIVGVIKDFHYGKAEFGNEEVILRYSKNKGNFLNVKIASTDWLATFQNLETAWRKIDNVHPLDAQLYTERIAYSYRELAAMLKMMGFLAFLAICIACLGLLGMVIFVTETRLKEISIRKVLGASEQKLVYLLSKGFLTLLIIAGAIALPITYLFFNEVAFMEMQNHTTIGAYDMLSGFTCIMIFAILLIASQTIRAARTNPATVLKNE